MAQTEKLVNESRRLINNLNSQQSLILNQLRNINNSSQSSACYPPSTTELKEKSNNLTSGLKKSKSVSFLEPSTSRLQEIKSALSASNSSERTRSILKKQHLNGQEYREPFVINIPDNVSRINIDEYLKNVQDQRRKCLNFSYTEDDESIIDEEDSKANDEDSIPKRNQPWNELKHWRSLFDDGNNRDAYNTVRTNLSSSQSWVNEDVDQIKKRIHDREHLTSKEQQQLSNKQSSTMNNTNLKQQFNRKKVLLGYDFVAGVLDNKNSTIMEQPDSYWDDLVSFRQKNADDCASWPFTNDKDLIDFSKELELIQPSHCQDHTCIHNFTLNDRLFTIPTNPDANGQSRCPICLSLRKEPNNYEPQYARVSVPKYRLNSNTHKFQPQKRSNIDTTDSFALFNHCIAGFGNARSALDKSAKSIDLRTESGTQIELSKMSLDDAQHLASSKDLCHDLLRRSTALRYHMQTLYQERLRRLRKQQQTPMNSSANTSFLSQ
ncbi:unnamed protein product, partial [Didymodactylos carnosus]